jgi:hypothetical protein
MVIDNEEGSDVIIGHPGGPAACGGYVDTQRGTAWSYCLNTVSDDYVWQAEAKVRMFELAASLPGSG